jgi:transcriptional regulator with XRE-family HTH domain
MDYYEIGQRIRKFRKARSLSQEQLAEKTGVSVTHMSHIETGNTKLSLPVLVSIAEALGVKTDDLLYERSIGRSDALGELASVLEGCTAEQARIISDIAKAAKAALDSHIQA